MKPLGVAAAVAVLGSALAAAPARADVDYFHAAKKPTTVTFDTSGSRSRNQWLAIGAFAGAAVIAGGVGVYYNLDSKDAADAVSARHLTGQVWSAALQADYDRAHASGVKAEVAYGVGGALLIGAAIALIVTEPGDEPIELGPGKPGAPTVTPKVTPTVAPTPGGAMIGGVWTF